MQTVTDSSKQVWPTQKWERNHATWTHLTVALSMTSWLWPVGLALSLVLWLTKRDQSWYMDDHGKEVVNFQITWLPLMFIAFLLVLTQVLAPAGFIIWFIGVVSAIRGAVAAHHGRLFRYPACLRFIR